LLRRIESTPIPWRHPAYGSGQVCTSLQQQAEQKGAQFWFDTALNKIETDDGNVSLVHVKRGSEELQIRPKVVVSSLPIEFLARLLGLPKPASTPAITERRSTLCVCLFFDEAPRFPHSWLKVTCPNLKAGRITNYAIFSRNMVPSDKTCLCVEFCCLGQDPLLDEDDESIRDLAIAEASGAGLVVPTAEAIVSVKRMNKVDWIAEHDDESCSGIELKNSCQGNLRHQVIGRAFANRRVLLHQHRQIMLGIAPSFRSHSFPEFLACRRASSKAPSDCKRKPEDAHGGTR